MIMLQSIQRTTKYTLVALILGFATACATTSDEVDLLDKSFMLYEHALRWQDYDVIIGFHKNEHDKLTEVRRKYLKQFRVTGYDVVYTKVAGDERSATQIVEVKYYNEAYNVVREMTLNHKWEFDEEKELWQVSNDLPDFK